jgi:hypothetical protein
MWKLWPILRRGPDARVVYTGKVRRLAEKMAGAARIELAFLLSESSRQPISHAPTKNGSDGQSRTDAFEVKAQDTTVM